MELKGVFDICVALAYFVPGEKKVRSLGVISE
jgi:hypothetical protein